MIKRLAGLCVVCVVISACSSEQKKDSAAAAVAAKTEANAAAPGASSADAVGVAAVTVMPGVAGGTVEQSLNATATVTAVDTKSRKVTLQPAGGGPPATFTASEAVRNLEQLKVGDTVNATLNEQLVVLVGPPRESGTGHAALVARAPKGAKPGAIVAETFEIVAAVSAIDAPARKATLKFDDGQTIDVGIRPDVDLSKYKVGDSVTIRVTQQLKLLAQSGKP